MSEWDELEQIADENKQAPNERARKAIPLRTIKRFSRHYNASQTIGRFRSALHQRRKVTISLPHTCLSS